MLSAKLFIYLPQIVKTKVIEMEAVTVSSEFQVVIPEEIRRKIGIKAKQKLVVIEKDGVIHLIPQRPIEEMRGFIKGISAEEIRDEEDRF
jgi:AbrB family looped-hinge helix DNA binding protein